jgi:hypothetical protein
MLLYFFYSSLLCEDTHHKLNLEVSYSVYSRKYPQATSHLSRENRPQMCEARWLLRTVVTTLIALMKTLVRLRLPTPQHHHSQILYKSSTPPSPLLLFIIYAEKLHTFTYSYYHHILPLLKMHLPILTLISFLSLTSAKKHKPKPEHFESACWTPCNNTGAQQCSCTCTPPTPTLTCIKSDRSRQLSLNLQAHGTQRYMLGLGR